ncbi:UDP-Glycosyltransferase/glycogen phosphorylase [Thozetella sp. PMI_491]|nr:UDP-Glycosyltransferase/glycogen phosphorylase [Thozetella sp. PMI_491]
MTSSPEKAIAGEWAEDLAPVADSFPPFNGFDGYAPESVILKDDGRVDVDFDSKLVRTLSVLHPKRIPHITATTPPPDYVQSIEGIAATTPKLNLVIHVVGSRGDVQPFVALGSVLARYGHRVRLATHAVFEKFVHDANLEFFSIGGDPAELMAYMVKNPGLIPSMKSLQAGDIERKRWMVREMLEGCWSSCVLPDPMTGKPFIADAIIANPPSFAHIHCAEALSIPVHLMFTMPWSPTASFPHPLANIKNARSDRSLANQLSYLIVDWLTWQGLGDVINKWRKSIELDEVAMFDGPILAQTLKVPFTYCWSPALIAKPADWPAYIDVCGFFFRDAPDYEPSAELRQFLTAGPPPVYIGFGSIVMENPHAMMDVVVQAVQAAGVRAIVSEGWSGLQGSPSDDIHFIGDCPHEWLFQHVAAVVHHGGAGTTACGLRFGKPTTIVPFFGDQPFWGQMIANAGAGPQPIPHRELTVTKLAEAIHFCLSPQSREAASLIAERMSREDGVQAAVESFHRCLPLGSIRCDLLADQPAAWLYKGGKCPVKLSKIAAQSLLDKGLIQAKHLTVYETKPFSIETSRWDPVSGGASAVMSTAVDLATSVTGIVTRPMDEYRDDRKRAMQKRQHEEKLQERDDKSSMASTSGATTGKKEQSALTRRMIGASAKSIGGFAPTALKGMMVDIPVAITEGLRSIPSHYGDEVRDHGKVNGIRSGATVAGKNFAWGFWDGLSDLVVQPYRGAAKEGAVGALKGVGKGVVGLTTKTGAGMFGLLAYTSAGISKSVRSALHSRIKKQITDARFQEGRYMVESGQATGLDINGLWTNLEALAAGKKG